MSEEEKQVIKRLKDDIELVTFNGNLNYGVGNLYTNINDLKILLNLIDKLQKELDNSISKDIIRDKIKELGSIKGDLATYIAVTEKMKILNELLGG